MKIDKAIEILHTELNEHPYHVKTDLYFALKLGLEALKRQKLMREHSGMSFDYYLPGETEDNSER